MIQLPEHPLPAKPRFMQKCNGCGLCCSVEICPIGELAFPGAAAPCPGIVFKDGRTFCALVLAEKDSGFPPIVAMMLGIERGCDANDDDDEGRTT